MSNRTLINGTAYDIKSGSVLIEGTGYAIQKGRTLINGMISQLRRNYICTIKETNMQRLLVVGIILLISLNLQIYLSSKWGHFKSIKRQMRYTSTIIYQITMMCLLFSAPIVWWIYLHILR